MSDASTYSVDRIEGDVAVLVDDTGHSVPVPVSQLPASICVGDVLRLRNGIYEPDRAETDARRSLVLSLQDKIRKKKQ